MVGQLVPLPYCNVTCRIWSLKLPVQRATGHLCTFPTDATGQLNILGHDGHTLGMDCTQVSVLEETYEICLGGFLQGEHGQTLETQVGLRITEAS